MQDKVYGGSLNCGATVWSCLCASGSSSSRRRPNALGCPTMDLPPPILPIGNKQEIPACFDFAWLTIGVPSPEKPAGATLIT